MAKEITKELEIKIVSAYTKNINRAVMCTGFEMSWNKIKTVLDKYQVPERKTKKQKLYFARPNYATKY